MTDEAFRTSRHAVRLARLAQLICLVGAGSRVVFAYSVGSSRVAMGAYIRGLAPNLPATISDQTWLAFGVVLAMDLFLSVWVFLIMFGLFGALGRGDMKSEGFERRLLALNFAAILGLLLSIFGRTLYSLAAYLTDVPPPHGWGIDLSQNVLYKAVATISLFLFVMIVRELRRVDAENKSFV